MTESFLDDTPSDTAAAVIAGQHLAEPQQLDDDGRFFSVVVPDGATRHLVDLQVEEQKTAAHPRRKTGTVKVQTADSFIAYMEKHGLSNSEVFADPARRVLVGVINAHGAGDNELAEGTAGHSDHRVSLELIPTKAWKTWIELDRKLLRQEVFAEHIEENAVDVVDPDSATMLEIAKSLIATTTTDFKSAIRLQDGQVQLQYEETSTARAGQKGELEIPQTFTVSVAPFEGADPVELSARFRYRINSGTLHLSYVLLKPEDVAYNAFLEHVQNVRDGITQPVFQGSPA